MSFAHSVTGTKCAEAKGRGCCVDRLMEAVQRLAYVLGGEWRFESAP
jgi:hypothetical protein